MSREMQKPSETLPQDKPSNRRDLLTGALLGLGTGALVALGASVLVQANANAGSRSRRKEDTKKTEEKKSF